MIIKKTFRQRLRPKKKDLKKFASFSGASRFVFNRGLAERSSAWKDEKRSLSLYDQNNALTTLKNQEETLWLADIHSQILQQSLHDLDLAFKNFFRRLKNREEPGYPRFKCKGDKDSFRYPQGVKIEDEWAWLPKIGWVRFRKTREIKGKLKQTTIIKEGNAWYICFACEWESADQLQQCQSARVVGIDVGLENFATTICNGKFKEIDSPRFLAKNLSHLKYLGRQLSNKIKFSKNWYKAKTKLQIFHARLKRSRQDFLHKLSSDLVKNHDVIAVENLKVKELLMNAPRALARNISDAGWSQFFDMLKYKCTYAGKQLVEAAEFFPSTQLCSQCGCRNKLVHCKI